jgi:hypothetical protein
LQLGFQLVAVVGRRVQKQETDNTKGETIHKTIEKTQNAQKIKQKYKTRNKHKKNT